MTTQNRDNDDPKEKGRSTMTSPFRDLLTKLYLMATIYDSSRIDDLAKEFEEWYARAIAEDGTNV